MKLLYATFFLFLTSSIAAQSADEFNQINLKGDNYINNFEIILPNENLDQKNISQENKNGYQKLVSRIINHYNSNNVIYNEEFKDDILRLADFFDSLKSDFLNAEMINEIKVGLAAGNLDLADNKLKEFIGLKPVLRNIFAPSYFAEAQFQRALIFEKRFNLSQTHEALKSAFAEDPSNVKVLSRLAWLEAQIGQHELARSRAELADRLLRDSSATEVRTIIWLANTYHEIGMLDMARTRLELALKRVDDPEFMTSASHLSVLNSLAAIYSQLGIYEASTSRFFDALTLLQAKFPGTRVEMFVRNNLALNLNRVGCTSLPKAILQPIRDMVPAILSSKDYMASYVVRNFSNALFNNGQISQAKTELRFARDLAIDADAIGLGHWRIQYFDSKLAEILIAEGKYEEARLLLSEIGKEIHPPASRKIELFLVRVRILQRFVVWLIQRDAKTLTDLKNEVSASKISSPQDDPELASLITFIEILTLRVVFSSASTEAVEQNYLILNLVSFNSMIANLIPFDIRVKLLDIASERDSLKLCHI